MTFDAKWIEENCYKNKITGCWEWMGSIFSSGYGRFKWEGEALRAHVEMYKKTKGSIPKGLKVLHHCDNKPCCNPEHIYAGTNKRNTKDALQRGRFCIGDRHDRTKIPDAEIIKIMNDCRPNTVICKDYGVTNQLISQIKRGLTRRHITNPEYHK